MAESITELVQQINLNTFEVESSYWVDITHINDPHDFYIRPRAYNSCMPALQAPGKIFKSSEIQSGVKIIFKSMIACTYVRGQVRFIEQGEDDYNYVILAPDYGFIEKGVLASHIFTPYKNFSVPPLATKCKLAHCKPFEDGATFSDNAISAMKHCIGKERAKMIVRIKFPDILVVDLYNSMPDDISTLLALNGYTKLGFSSNIASCVTPPKRSYYEYRDIKVGETMLVRTLSGKSLNEFYVADINDHKNYIRSKTDFNYNCKHEPKLKIDELKVGQPVAVRDELGGFEFERAFIKEITVPETKAMVQLIDLGTLKETPIWWISPLKSEYYFQRAATAILCAAEERQACDSRMDKYLHPGKEFLITIKKLGKHFEEPYIVTILPSSTK